MNRLPTDVTSALEMMRFGCPLDKPLGDPDVAYFERRMLKAADILEGAVRQSLSQEAVRDEVLEEAAKVCERLACPDVKPPWRAAPGYEYLENAAKAIRALKREPTAAEKTYRIKAEGLGPAPAAPDVLGEQPTHFEMARTRMLRKRIADIVATHDAFVADHTNRERVEALRHAIDKARGISLTKAEQEKQEDYDCPHAYPHRYCETCRVDPCPLGLGKKSPPAPGASDD